MIDFLKRTWAVIHLDHLEENINQIQRYLPTNTQIMSVVKADAYGHGDQMIAQTLQNMGVNFFAVSNLEEALSLRRCSINTHILVLGFTPVSKAPLLAANNISQTVFSIDYAMALNQEAERAGCSIKIHIKIDTGMGRIGFFETEEQDASIEIEKIIPLTALSIEGIFTHLSSADAMDPSSLQFTKQQIERFERVIHALSEKNIHFPLLHLQNSAGIGFQSSLHYDYARAGIIQYGLAPSKEAFPFPLKPVMELKTVISMIKEVPEGVPISYGRTFTTKRKSKIAAVPIGYADGYPRLLSNRAEMLLHGKRVPVVGTICMDQLMLDVTEISDVSAGDIVTVIGKDGDQTISFDELAGLIGTINYELICLIGRRVPRVYMKKDKIIEVIDYLHN